MPPGEFTIAGDQHNDALVTALSRSIGEGQARTDTVDVFITSTVPDRSAHHVVITGELTDALDEWDRGVEPQTVAGALWVPTGQQAQDAALAWLLIRRETPTTPLSDLTDDHGRALRWSVVAARQVTFPSTDEPIVVDEDEIRAWVDEQPQVQDLGTALERIGGDSAQAVLDSTERFRNALVDLDHVTAGLPPVGETRDLAAAVAEQLREVQRSGLGKWRSGKARAEAQAATSAAARTLAADRVQALIDLRREQVVDGIRAQRDRERAGDIRTALAQTLAGLELPAAPDFARCPRSWSDSAPSPRRYVLVNEAQLELVGEVAGASVRLLAEIPADTALCAVVQSGFSLPAIR